MRRVLVLTDVACVIEASLDGLEDGAAVPKIFTADEAVHPGLFDYPAKVDLLIPDIG